MGCPLSPSRLPGRHGSAHSHHRPPGPRPFGGWCTAPRVRHRDGVPIDLNADVGESFGRWTLGNDADLVPLLTSANVAGGFHAGDPATIRRACALAADHDVSVGAQVGYRDLAGFGRRFIDMGMEDLVADLVYQIGAVRALAASVGARVGYVKPHGALYHAMSTSPDQAWAVAHAAAVTGGLGVVAFPGSRLVAKAEQVGLEVYLEGFADRRYAADGTLVPRTEPGALITDPAEVAEQATRLATSGEVHTVCLHGDTPGVVALATAVRERWEAEGLVAGPFVA